MRLHLTRFSDLFYFGIIVYYKNVSSYFTVIDNFESQNIDALFKTHFINVQDMQAVIHLTAQLTV